MTIPYQVSPNNRTTFKLTTKRSITTPITTTTTVTVSLGTPGTLQQQLLRARSPGGQDQLLHSCIQTCTHTHTHNKHANSIANIGSHWEGP